jgi:hypothetical protein
MAVPVKSQAAIPPKPLPTPHRPLPVPPPKPPPQASATKEAEVDKELFDSLDRNNDNQLLPTAQGTVQGVKIAQYDTDKNGVVSREAFVKGRAADRK